MTCNDVFTVADGGCLAFGGGEFEICVEAGDLLGDTLLCVTENVDCGSNVDVTFGSAPGKGVAVGCFDLEPDGLVFANPVTLTIRQDISNLNANQRDRLDLFFRGQPGDPFGSVSATCCPEEVPPSEAPQCDTAPCYVAVCSTEITHFSTYAIIAAADSDDDGVPDTCHAIQATKSFLKEGVVTHQR